MPTSPSRLLLALAALVLLAPARPCLAQMDGLFDSIFESFLADQIRLSGAGHENHYLPAANRAAEELTPALNRMVSQNLSALPLSSSIAGTIFEDTPQGLRMRRTSWGPIFAETGTTLGRGSLNVGVSYSNLSFDQYRGLDTEDIAFAFTHEDVDPNDGELGALVMESDVMNVVMGMDIDASVFAFTGTYGLLDNLDLSVALPVIQLEIAGTATARIISHTYGVDFNGQGAMHRFGGDGDDPVLDADYAYSESVTGIGDLALRAKYSLKQTDVEQYGALLDLRLPTGAEEDFLGTGAASVRATGIYSRTFDRFTPHVNLAYTYHDDENRSDELAFALGFDQSVSSRLSFAADVLGLVPLGTEQTVSIGPGQTLVEFRQTNYGAEYATRVIDDSNVPDYDRDNLYNLSLGFRYAPWEQTILQANLMVPLNDGGLRSDVATSLGFAYYR